MIKWTEGFFVLMCGDFKFRTYSDFHKIHISSVILSNDREKDRERESGRERERVERESGRERE